MGGGEEGEGSSQGGNTLSSSTRRRTTTAPAQLSTDLSTNVEIPAPCCGRRWSARPSFVGVSVPHFPQKLTFCWFYDQFRAAADTGQPAAGRALTNKPDIDGGMFATFSERMDFKDELKR